MNEAATTMAGTSPLPEASPVALAAAYARARVEELTDQLSALDRRLAAVSSVPEDSAVPASVRDLRPGMSEVSGAFYTIGDDLEVLIRRVSLALSRLEV